MVTNVSNWNYFQHLTGFPWKSKMEELSLPHFLGHWIQIFPCFFLPNPRVRQANQEGLLANKSILWGQFRDLLCNPICFSLSWSLGGGGRKRLRKRTVLKEKAILRGKRASEEKTEDRSHLGQRAEWCGKEPPENCRHKNLSNSSTATINQATAGRVWETLRRPSRDRKGLFCCYCCCCKFQWFRLSFYAQPFLLK